MKFSYQQYATHDYPTFGGTIKVMLIVVITGTIVFMGGIVSGQGNQKAYPEYDLKLSDVTEQLRYLASDELKGRRTGTSGNDAAARYIAEQFRANGLATVPGADDYLQPVTLAKVAHSILNTVVIGTDTLRQGRELVALQAGQSNLTAAIIFVDYGILNEETAQDDLQGVDLKGKIVVARFGSGGHANVRAGMRESRKKYTRIAEKGAAGLIELYSGDFPWRRLASFLSRPRYTVEQPNDQIETRISHILIDDSAQKYLAEFTEKSDLETVSLKFHPPEKTPIVSSNVMGIIQGADTELRKEYILVSAHFDHLGVRSRPENPAADSIYNGARDNGMGTVALIAASKALAEVQPARSLIFIAFTGEEMGLLGSEFYVEHPLIPLKSTVFVLNTDGAGYTDTSIVTVIGIERSTAQTAIEEATKEVGLTVIPDPVPEQHLFNASDNAPFARKGIPTLTFSPGFRAFDEALRRFYHQPEDEADENFDFNYLLRYCKAFAHSVRFIANMPQRPRWNSGDEYESLSNKLYQEDR